MTRPRQVPQRTVLLPLAVLAAGLLPPAAAPAAPVRAPADQAAIRTAPPPRGWNGRSSSPQRPRTSARPGGRTARRVGSGRRHVLAAVRRWSVPGRVPLAGLLTPPAPGTSVPAPATPTPTDPATPILTDVLAPLSTAVGLRLADTPSYLAVLSRLTAPAGAVRLQVRNDGEDPHDLRVERVATGAGVAHLDPLPPGATSTRTLDLTPGEYRLFCTFGAPVDHSDAGMRATLTVTG